MLLDLKVLTKGKVREVYDLNDKLLIVASDRVSAFDHVLPNLIPNKGQTLTQISVFWFKYLANIVQNHLITTNVHEYPENLQKYKDQLEGRSMLVKRAKRIDIECIVRGYLAGSGWKEYKKTGHVCGIKLPDNLKQSDKLPEAIFTPTTKAEIGKHDENLTEEQAIKLVGAQVFDEIKKISLELYKKASSYALSKGIIIADTKFEFGFIDNKICLIDEVFTPDSSRFWSLEDYAPGKSQDSYDKQIIRNYLESINWDKKPPVPNLPQEIIDKTVKKYEEVYRKLV